MFNLFSRRDTPDPATIKQIAEKLKKMFVLVGEAMKMGEAMNAQLSSYHESEISAMLYGKKTPTDWDDSDAAEYSAKARGSIKAKIEEARECVLQLWSIWPDGAPAYRELEGFLDGFYSVVRHSEELEKIVANPDFSVYESKGKREWEVWRAKNKQIAAQADQHYNKAMSLLQKIAPFLKSAM